MGINANERVLHILQSSRNEESLSHAVCHIQDTLCIRSLIPQIQPAYSTAQPTGLHNKYPKPLAVLSAHEISS